MPTVAQIGPYRFFFYSNEGDESPHIHVKREGKVAKFWLDPVDLAAAGGFAAHELREIERLVAEHQASWIGMWHEYFNN